MQAPDPTRFILLNTSHPGNVGAAARAMKVMGFCDLVLVAPRAPVVVRADGAAVQGLLEHWQQGLTAIGFLDPQAPKKLMPRLNQLFNRAQLTPEEVHILRGIARAMEKSKFQD